MDEYNVWAGLDKQDTVDTSSQLSAAFSEGCGCQRTAGRQWLILPSPRCWQGQPNCNLSTSNQERERQKEDIKVISFCAVELWHRGGGHQQGQGCSWGRAGSLCLNIIFTRMLRLQYDNRYYPFNVQNESVVFLVEYSTRLLSASPHVLFQISLILLLSSNHYLDQPPHLQTHLHQAQRGEGRARRRRGLGKQQ